MNLPISRRLTANDVCSRVALSRLLIKIDRNQEYSKTIGIEGAFRYRSEAAYEEKEVENHVEYSGTYFYHDRAV